MFYPHLLVCLFVSRILQKLLTDFQKKLVERWHMARNKPLDFGGNSYVGDKIRVGLWLQSGGVE